MELSHRERVKLTLNHIEADRVPLDLCGSTNNIVDPLYFKVKDKLGIKGDIAPYRSGRTCSYYDERILEALDTDFRHLWLKSPKSYKRKMFSDGSYLDEWGVTMKKMDNSVEVIDYPLKDDSMDDLEKHTWPDTNDTSRVKGLKERAISLKENTDYAISAKFVSSGGFLEHGGWLRGFENFMVDMMLNKEFANALMDKVLNIKLKLYEMMLTEVGPYVDIVEMAEDFGTQSSLLISPETFREYIKPRYKEIISLIRELAPNAKISHHSCGAVSKLIPEFIDLGIDILDPIQISATGMEPEKLKDLYGKDLVFHGAIDIQRALPGSLDDVRNEVRTRIKELAKGGGYIISPTNHIQNDTPPENVIELYKFAKEIGKY